MFAVAFSPFHRHLLLTASSDGSARLYNVLQQRPVLTLEPSTSSLFAACWSPSRPTVFAVGGADGNLYVYDVGKSRGLPEATLQVTTNKSPLYSIMFNPQSPQLVATADAQGYVKVWRLSHALNTMGPRDKRALDRLADARRPATKTTRVNVLILRSGASVALRSTLRRRHGGGDARPAGRRGPKTALAAGGFE